MYIGSLINDTEVDELAVFRENYASLCNIITDVNELLKYFVTENIISMDQEEVIKTSCVTKSDKVSTLLLHISHPLESGDSNGFYTMLQIMKICGVDATQRLADQIITRVDKSKLPNLVNVSHNFANSKGLLNISVLYLQNDCLNIIKFVYATVYIYTGINKNIMQSYALPISY